MESNSIAFAVQYDGAKAMRPNRVSGLDDRTAIWDDFTFRLPDSTVHVEVDQYTACCYLFLVMNEATAVAVLMIKDAKGKVTIGLFLDTDAQHLSIELCRPVQIGYGNIKPHRPVNFTIEIAH